MNQRPKHRYVSCALLLLFFIETVMKWYQPIESPRRRGHSPLFFCHSKILTVTCTLRCHQPSHPTSPPPDPACMQQFEYPTCTYSKVVPVLNGMGVPPPFSSSTPLYLLPETALWVEQDGERPGGSLCSRHLTQSVVLRPGSDGLAICEAGTCCETTIAWLSSQPSVPRVAPSLLVGTHRTPGLSVVPSICKALHSGRGREGGEG